ncbi:putative bifunctional diguanylate cyclase/phosphodiesterase [Winogradskya humida]|uniref:Diguanylate cyclase (GGDEF)-like protein n=1 Tax=Winogradskya humida TaxID=113566 RepID=A0ABQ4A659_9ACTN|nr:bifunctional diguanylate cyclase/phosphodiesterase [Actinoplanes humidus]GIE26330.1 hypothetical protein Ahu01nite_094320 [Actinoplanes humidus]
MSWIAVALTAIVVAAQIVALLVDGARLAITSYSLTVLDVLGLVYSLRATRRGMNRFTWQSLSTARVMSMVSTACLITALHSSQARWWWIGVITGLITYVCLALAAVAVPAQRLQGSQWAAFAAEVLTVTGCGFMFIWHFVLSPIVESGTRGHLLVLALGFPLGDLLLLVAVTAFLLRSGFLSISRPVVLLVAGIGLYLVADLLLDGVGNDGVRSMGSRPATVSMVAASLLLTLAARWQASTPTTTTTTAGASPVPPVWATYFPYAATAAGFTLMIVVTVLDNALMSWGGLVLGMIVMTGAVVARQLLSLRASRSQTVTDMLTGLANRTGLHHALDRAVRRQAPVALFAIHLDGFDQINTLHGRSVGKALLTEFAHLLRSTTRSTDIAARAGGDEFTLLAHDIRTPGEATAVAHRLLTTVTASPVTIGELTLTLQLSIGISLTQPDTSVEELTQRAAVALYQAERAGKHSYALYDPSMIDRRTEDALLARDLDHAVPDGQLLVLYQPMVDLATGQPRGVEALVRWQHPHRGLISPLDFIPIAERTGAITIIGLHVLEQACHQIQDWRRQLPADRPFYVSVNVSPRQLQEPTLVDDILAVLARTGMKPADLVLEVTESAVVDEQIAIPALRTLREHGIRVAIDDFGTGYSSLHYLTRLPVDILKIDRSFVNELNGTAEGAAVAQAIIHLSKALHLSTVAEGIETTRQATELQHLGCDIGQGYLYARPLVPDDVTAMLLHHVEQQA